MIDRITRREAIGALLGATAAAAIRPAFAPASEGGLRNEMRVLGRSGLRVSALGFGGMRLALANSPQEEADRILNNALDLGLAMIDTAECYGEPGGAHSEILIGNAVGHRRDEFVLASKVGHERGAYGSEVDYSKASIHRTIERSLRRLKTDHLDICFLHSAGLDEMRNTDAIEALLEAKQKGTIRATGSSNDGPRALHSIETGEIDVLQITYNILDMDMLDRVLPAAIERNLGVVIKRPMANACWRYEEGTPRAEYFSEYRARIRAMDLPAFRGELVRDPGPDGAAGLALRFVLSTPGVDTAIVGTASPGRYEQNLGNVQELLTPAQWRAIRDRWLACADGGWRLDEWNETP
jgi:aryl-alcohol dehydrogenase-like predicted oxidoreductase